MGRNSKWHWGFHNLRKIQRFIKICASHLEQIRTSFQVRTCVYKHLLQVEGRRVRHRAARSAPAQHRKINWPVHGVEISSSHMCVCLPSRAYTYERSEATLEKGLFCNVRSIPDLAQWDGAACVFLLELVFCVRKIPQCSLFAAVCSGPGCQIGPYKRAAVTWSNHNLSNSSTSNMKTTFVFGAVVLLVAVAQAYPQQLEAQLSPGEKHYYFEFVLQ